MNKYTVYVTYMIETSFEFEAEDIETATELIDEMSNQKLKDKCPVLIPSSAQFDNFWVTGPDGSSN